MNNIIYSDLLFIWFPSQCFLRLMEVSQDEDELWIYRDKKSIIRVIKLNVRMIYLKTVVNRIYLNCPPYLNNYNFFLKNIFFPVNQTLSSKMSYFIRHFKIYGMVDLHNQFAFAVIELIKGDPILIGPFKPKKIHQTGKHCETHHTEHQCIQLLDEHIKKNKSMIKAIYMFTKYSPCLGIKGHCDPCMIKLANFSEEMINKYNIDLYITFQDMYGASGNIVKVLKDSSSYKDPFIRKKVLELKEMMNKKLCRSKFIGKIFQENQRISTSKTIKSFIKEEMLECNLMKREDVSYILKVISVKFPSKPMAFYEFKNYGEGQANEIKKQLRNLNVSEEITEKICAIFYSKWCHLVYVEYEEFIYQKFSDYINTCAVAFTYKDIKTITNHFNLERVELTL